MVKSCETSGRSKEIYLDVVKEDMKEVGTRDDETTDGKSRKKKKYLFRQSVTYQPIDNFEQTSQMVGAM